MAKKTALLLILDIILFDALVLLYTWRSGFLHQAYVACVTELRLVRRGNQPVLIRFDLKNGMNRVYIPAGEFSMGSVNAYRGKQGQVHKVYLDGFWIGQTDVTNSMFALCFQAGKCSRPAHYDNYFYDPKYADYPVVYINWYQAEDFCEWDNGRLPTEAEWEKAARGTDQRPYPWGNLPPDKSLLNFNGLYQEPRSSYDYLTGISPYGLLNMSGNVRQWVSDWFDPNYYSISPYKDPQGPLDGVNKSLRGSSYADDSQQAQTFYRQNHDPASAGADRGFRCAYNAGSILQW